MKLFLDTANVEDIRTGVELGVIDGVTTNPTLVAKEGGSMEKRIKEIVEVCHGPISAEVLATDYQGMVEEAEKLSQIEDNIVVKIPITSEGLKATKELSGKGVSVNMTLIFSLNQAVLAAKAGADYVSPFVGRIDDIGGDGMQLVEEMITSFQIYGFDAQVIAASIRHPRHVTEAARMGCDIVTVPKEVLDKMLGHPLTDKGIEKFMEDWRKSQQT